MNEYINSLNVIQSIYFYMALFGSILFLLQSVFTFLDLGDTFSNDADFDGDLEVDSSFLGLSLPFNLLSMRGMIAFIMIFGMSGLSFSRSGMPEWLAFLLALLCGLTMMVIIGLIYYWAFMLKDSGNIDLNSAVGKECEVYLTIPHIEDGMGKVHIVLNGSLREYDAITYEELIHNGTFVKVIAVMNDKLVVERVSNETKI